MKPKITVVEDNEEFRARWEKILAGISHEYEIEILEHLPLDANHRLIPLIEGREHFFILDNSGVGHGRYDSGSSFAHIISSLGYGEFVTMSSRDDCGDEYNLDKPFFDSVNFFGMLAFFLAKKKIISEWEACGEKHRATWKELYGNHKKFLERNPRAAELYEKLGGPELAK